jgi:hypothetical protein
MYKLIQLSLFSFLISSYLFANTDEKLLFNAGWKKAASSYFDTNSKLVWDKTVRKGTWEQARLFCQKYKLDNKTNWTLPTIVQFQSAVCYETAYKTRVACKKPRDHNKDLWLLIDPSKKYWTIDLVPGDPYNAYFFEPISEGQHIISTKNDVHHFVCVRNLEDELLKEVVYLKEKEFEKHKIEQITKNFEYYFASHILAGAYLSNDTSDFNDLLFFGIFELRAGYNSKALDNNLYFTFSADIGIDIKHFELPLLSNIVIGPEYFINNYISLYGGAGLGISRKQRPIGGNNYLAENSFGLAWKLSSTLNFIQWGKYKNQKNIPIVISYSGTRTSSADMSHVFALGFGFKLFE